MFGFFYKGNFITINKEIDEDDHLFKKRILYIYNTLKLSDKDIKEIILNSLIIKNKLLYNSMY
jgi:hypothetical protein